MHLGAGDLAQQHTLLLCKRNVSWIPSTDLKKNAVETKKTILSIKQTVGSLKD